MAASLKEKKNRLGGRAGGGGGWSGRLCEEAFQRRPPGRALSEEGAARACEGSGAGGDRVGALQGPPIRERVVRDEAGETGRHLTGPHGPC